MRDFLLFDQLLWPLVYIQDKSLKLRITQDTIYIILYHTTRIKIGLFANTGGKDEQSEPQPKEQQPTTRAILFVTGPHPESSSLKAPLMGQGNFPQDREIVLRFKCSEDG